MSKVVALYHVVFCTKHRKNTLPIGKVELLYYYIWGILKNHNCFLHRIGGIENHIHLLFDLPPDTALSDIMRMIKSDSSTWLKANQEFPFFNGWAREYYASTISIKELEPVKRYIAEQKEHHKRLDFAEELRRIGEEYGLTYFDKDLTD